MLLRFILSVLIATAPLAATFARDTIITEASRPGVTQSFILMEPDDKPARAVILAWPSGDGVIGLTKTGMTHTVAFFPRAAERFVAAGLALAIVDVPSDKANGLDYDFRVQSEHVADVAAVVDAVRTRTNAPIFLAGFSRGTLSVTNAAARLATDTIIGVILASGVTVRAGIARRSLHDTPLSEIDVPVLTLNHRDDDCMLTLASNAPALLNAFTAAPRKDSRILTDGSLGGGGCFAHTSHDFLGAEDQAITVIGAWIDSVLAAR